ncbi:MAG: hypothetical protein FJ005_05420 [Chloroflexi bacterium]|nr:hypothetical protein [Chloroflexota bacterium]
MEAKGKSNLYLYLALVCFVGILAIFVVDGYLGIYDTLYITVQEHEQVIEPDYWQQSWVKESGYTTGTRKGEPVYFRYKIENRSFSTYLSNVEASVWKGGKKILQMLDEDVQLAPFEDVTLDWTLRVEDLEKAGFWAGEYGEYTVRIELGQVERKIILSYYPEVPGYLEKIPPQPVPVPEPSR